MILKAKEKCGHCGGETYKHSEKRRRIKTLGITGPTEIFLKYEIRRCKLCKKFQAADYSYIADKYKDYTKRALRMAGWAATKFGLTDGQIYMLAKWKLYIPLSTLCDVRADYDG